MTIDLVPVRSKAELRIFIALPRQLYAGLPGFVPSLDNEARELLDPTAAAFFTHGAAQYWLARRDGVWVGRISAQIDRLATSPAFVGCGFFGCLDAIDDEDVVRLLLGEAESWIASRGCASAQGPYQLSINGETGLLIDGQHCPRMTLMPWHPAYLRRHVEQAGYGLVKSLFCYTLDFRTVDVDAAIRRIGMHGRESELPTRRMDMTKMVAEAELGRRLYNDAWEPTWGYLPLSEADMAGFMHGFKPFLYPDSAVVVDVDGQGVGFALFIPNTFDVSAGLGGSPSVMGWVRLAWRVWRQRFRSARIILFGVQQRFHSTPQGAGIAMAIIAELLRRGQVRRLDWIEAGWILENNIAVIRILKALGFRQTRTYGIYQRVLPTPTTTGSAAAPATQGPAQGLTHEG